MTTAGVDDSEREEVVAISKIFHVYLTDGLAMTEVRPITDENLRTRLRQAILMQGPIHQVSFREPSSPICIVRRCCDARTLVIKKRQLIYLKSPMEVLNVEVLGFLGGRAESLSTVGV